MFFQTDLRRLWKTNLELSNWGRIIHQNEYRRLHRSHKERLTLPARERYEAFVRQFPEVCRRANLDFIASYFWGDAVYAQPPSGEWVGRKGTDVPAANVGYG